MSEWVSERGKGHSTHLKSNSSNLWYSIFRTELHCNQALKNFAIFWFLRIVRVYIFKQKTTLELAEVTRQASSSAISWRGAALSRTQNSFTASTIQRLTWVSPWKYFKQVLLGIEWHFLYPFFCFRTSRILIGETTRQRNSQTSFRFNFQMKEHRYKRTLPSHSRPWYTGSQPRSDLSSVDRTTE